MTNYNFGGGFVHGMSVGSTLGRNLREAMREYNTDAVDQVRPVEEAVPEASPELPQAQERQEYVEAARELEAPPTEAQPEAATVVESGEKAEAVIAAAPSAGDVPPVAAPKEEAAPVPEKSATPAATVAEEKAVVSEAVKAAAEPPAPAMTPDAPKKSVWSLGEGEDKKTFDHEPSAEEIRSWKYDTIRKNVDLSYANDWLKRDMGREALMRREAQERMQHDKALAEDQDFKEMRGLIPGAAKPAPGAATAPTLGANGRYESPNDAAGLRPDPVSLYRLRERQAAIIERSDPAKADQLRKTARMDAAGQMLSAYEKGDGDTLKSMYNIFPNGHLVSSVRVNKANGDVSYTSQDGSVNTVKRGQFVREVMAYADPKLAVQYMNNEDKAERVREQFEQKMAHKDQELRIKEDRLKLQQERAAGGGSGGSGGAGGKPDFFEVATKTKMFGEDGEANARLVGMAEKFYPGIASRRGNGDSKKGETGLAVNEALSIANEYNKRHAAYRAENPNATETEVQNALIPVAIDPATGIAARRMMVDPKDPQKGAYIYDGKLNEGAPQEVRNLRVGKQSLLPAMIVEARNGTLTEKDKAGWDAALKTSVSLLPEDQQDEIMKKWGAAGITSYVASIYPKAGGKAGKATVKAPAAKPTAGISEAFDPDTGESTGMFTYKMRVYPSQEAALAAKQADAEAEAKRIEQARSLPQPPTVGYNDLPRD